ncbi:hypothetical protein [Halobellus inordinatus]|uniref:hypothetical protein n=1 Tax=Halobellus inordinatus TaxID=1126236 RepID=UPI0021086730|nr:hypothetical protein [Halobellus inordinatus]
MSDRPGDEGSHYCDGLGERRPVPAWRCSLCGMAEGGDTDRPTDTVYHVVCHGCPFEQIVEGDRVLAAANEIVHRKRTDHAVEYAPVEDSTSR